MMIGHQVDIVFAVAKRRQTDREHVQTEEEIGAESALRDLLFQIGVRRGNDAHIDPHRLVAADPLERLFLKQPQQFHLREQRHLADFIEEDGAAVALLELADSLPVRAGERALLVPEQFALDELFREWPRS